MKLSALALNLIEILPRSLVLFEKGVIEAQLQLGQKTHNGGSDKPKYHKISEVEGINKWAGIKTSLNPNILIM